MYDLCIKNGDIANPDEIFKGNIYISGDKVAKITPCEILLPSKTTIDASGNYVMPGFIDPHAHLNDPGLTESEDFYTGTCSAAAGGITTVIEHPLTFPLPSTASNLLNKIDTVSPKAIVDFCLMGACTPDNYDEIGKMIGIGAIAFKAFMPYSVEIPQVNDGQLLDHIESLSGKGIVLTIHCENDDIVNWYTEKMIRENRILPINYPHGRPEIAEVEAINRAAIFAMETGGKINIAHCSTARGVEIVTYYKKQGVDISVETCPHYLTLNINDLEKLGVFGVCNPPLRSENIVDQMWNHVLSGNIDFIGSDHATYTFEEKDAGSDNIFKTPAGLTGIQTCFPLIFDEGVNKRKLDIKDFVKLSSTKAAKRYNIFPGKGLIEVGSDADMVIFDSKKKWTVKENLLFYKQKWTPYMDREITGWVDKTIVRGNIVYDNGHIVGEQGYGKFIKPILKKDM
ncbi:MAG: allantoinase AllB [Clostridiales bacterium]|nr:allantoinase AllB [Clostridiales bacterium]